MLARTDDGTVAVADGAAVLLDADGNVLARVDLPHDDPGTPPTALVLGDRIAVPGAAAVTMLEVGRGTLRIAWQRPGILVDGVADIAHPHLAMVRPNANVAASADLPTEIIDGVTGRPVWSGSVDIPIGGGRVLTATGLVANGPSTDTGRRTAIVGVDPDGRSMWRQPVGPATYLVVGSDVLVAVRPTPDDPNTSTLTLLG